MPSSKLLIYGSYGYTGKLIVDECLRRGIKPVLAGRNGTKLKEQAVTHELEYRAFPLDIVSEVAGKLVDIDAVLHCAGPFIHTAEVMSEACLGSGTHYLDITGEIEVFEMMASKSGKAKAAGIVLLPGVGFDVVPSDCLARHASEQMPDARFLKLFISFNGTFSAGTAATAIEHFAKGGSVRKGGAITKVEPGWKTEEVNFISYTGLTVTIPWGDVSTAYYSTGIADIEVYMRLPKKAIKRMKIGRFLQPLTRLAFVRNYLKKKVRRMGDGPDASEREKGETRVLSTVTDDAGNSRSFLQISPEGYTLTARTATDCALRVMNGEANNGFQTPSLAFGSDYIMNFEGVSRQSV